METPAITMDDPLVQEIESNLEILRNEVSLHWETETPAFKCVPVPGKGDGIIATRDIRYGELILEEAPVMEFSGEICFCSSEICSNSLPEICLENKFSKLSDFQQESVMSLHDINPIKSLEGVYQSNCLGNGGQGSILCLMASKFNHSCLNNLSHAYVAPYQRVFAVKDIKKGEELFFHYLGSNVERIELNKRQNRQDELWSKYRFHCHCELCDMSDKERLQIEEVFAKYNELDKALDLCYGDNERGLDLVREIFILMEKWHTMLPEVRAKHAYNGFQFAMGGEKMAEAKCFIKMAYTNSKITHGEDDTWTKLYFKYFTNPASFVEDSNKKDFASNPDKVIVIFNFVVGIVSLLLYMLS